MELKEIIRLYARSPLNVAIAGIFAAGALVWAAVFGTSAAGTLIGASAGYLAVSAIVLGTGKGASSVAAEKDRTRIDSARGKTEAAESDRRRIANLRITEPGVKAALDRFLVISGLYLEACKKNSTYSPDANDRISDALSVLSAFMKEIDEQAAEKHFGIPDDTPFPDIASRVITALDEDTAAVRSRTREMEGGLDAGDTMSIREDLQ